MKEARNEAKTMSIKKRGIGTVEMVLPVWAWRPDSSPQNAERKQGMVVCVLKPYTGKVETNEFLEHKGQLACPTQVCSGQVKFPVSK